MISKELNDWLQVVGLFGVLGGLIFVGLQLRLDRQVAIADGVNSAFESRMALAELLVEHEALWQRGLSEEDLTPVERSQFERLAEIYWSQYYNSWVRANELATSAPERWVRGAAFDLFNYPGLRRWWNQNLLASESLNAVREPSGWAAQVTAELSRLDREMASR